jgi:DNA-binding beta-propeller fold protein YncE
VNRRAAGLMALMALLSLSGAAHAQSLYWIDTYFTTPVLGWANADGTNPHSISLPYGSLPEGLALDAAGNKVYWTENAWSGARVMRAGASLAAATSLVAGGSSLHDIALDLTHGMMYWTSSNLVDGGQIHSAHLDGSVPLVIASLGTSANPRGIAVNPAASKLYWTDFDQGGIFSSNLAGAGIATVASTTPGLWGLAISADGLQLYATDRTLGTIRRFAIATGVPTTLVSGLSNPAEIAIDAANSRMYWSEAGAVPQKAKRANLDGTVIQNLNLPVLAFGGLAVGTTVVAGVDPADAATATAFALSAITPNPARDQAVVSYALPRAASVRLTVLDAQGRAIARLLDGVQPAGRHSIAWTIGGNRARVRPGLYFVRYEVPGREFSRRVAVTR